MTRSLVEQGMDHPYVKDHVAILMQNLEDRSFPPHTLSLIREEIEDFLRGSMRIALARPQQRPNTEDHQWKNQWDSDTEEVVLCPASQAHIETCVAKIEKLRPVRPSSLLKYSLQNAANTATHIVRFLACDMSPDDFIR